MIFMKLCFWGRIGLRAKEGVTRIHESSYRREGSLVCSLVCHNSYYKSRVGLAEPSSVQVKPAEGRNAGTVAFANPGSSGSFAVSDDAIFAAAR